MSCVEMLPAVIVWSSLSYFQWPLKHAMAYAVLMESVINNMYIILSYLKIVIVLFYLYVYIFTK